MFGYITNIFNNREIATILWTVGVSLVFYKDVWNVFLAALNLWRFWLLMILYIVGSVFILYKINFWNIDLLKITVFWVLGWAIAVFVNLTKIERNGDYLKKLVFEILGVTTFISFLSNFYSFSLVAELLIVPIAVMFSGLSIVATDSRYGVRKFSGGVVMALGLIIFFNSLYKTIENFCDFLSGSTLLEFLIPIFLSFMFIPFVYGLSFYVRWESDKKMRDILLKNKLKQSP